MEIEINGVTVDEVHDRVDALVLSIFEAMRSASGLTPSAESSASNIPDKFLSINDAIENLVGINRTNVQRVELLRDLSAKYEAVKGRTIQVEAELLAMQDSVNARIEHELCDLAST